jgi:hypothetical protein
MANKSLNTVNQDEETLETYDQMTDLGDLSWILGIH